MVLYSWVLEHPARSAGKLGSVAGERVTKLVRALCRRAASASQAALAESRAQCASWCLLQRAASRGLIRGWDLGHVLRYLSVSGPADAFVHGTKPATGALRASPAPQAWKPVCCLCCELQLHPALPISCTEEQERRARSQHHARHWLPLAVRGTRLPIASRGSQAASQAQPAQVRRSPGFQASAASDLLPCALTWLPCAEAWAQPPLKAPGRSSGLPTSSQQRCQLTFLQRPCSWLARRRSSEALPPSCSPWSCWWVQADNACLLQCAAEHCTACRVLRSALSCYGWSRSWRRARSSSRQSDCTGQADGCCERMLETLPLIAGCRVAELGL